MSQHELADEHLPSAAEIQQLRAENALLRKQLGDQQTQLSLLEDQQLRAENALLRKQLGDQQTQLSLLEDSLDGIWDWNIQTGDDYLSPRWKRMLGYEDSELPNHVDSWLKLLHPEDAPVGNAAVQAHLEHGAPYEIILRYLHKDGSTAWMMVRGKAARDHSGNWARMVGTHTDITLLKQTEAALRDSQERYRGIFQGAGIPLIEQDLTEVCQRLGTMDTHDERALRDLIAEHAPELIELVTSAPIADINPAAMDLFTAHKGEEVKGCVSSLWQLMHSDTLVDTMAAIAVRQEYFRVETEVRTTSGTHRIVVMTLTLAELSAGHVVARLGLLDITERRRAEEIMRNVATELEQQVRMRTADLELANRELEAFAYTVAHDLRAPLRAIDGFASLLMTTQGDKVDDMRQRYIERIRTSTQRMSTLIDDLLNLSRVIRATVNRQEIDLTKLVHDVISELREQEPERCIDISVREGMVVIADPGLLRIGVANLLQNAWKFTRQSERAAIEVGQRSSDGAYYVKDNGVGFDMRYAHKLFEPFQRLHHQSEFLGTGIGLATVERVLRRHGGRIFAESAIGSGATFYFSLKE